MSSHTSGSALGFQNVVLRRHYLILGNFVYAGLFLGPCHR